MKAPRVLMPRWKLHEYRIAGIFLGSKYSFNFSFDVSIAMVTVVDLLLLHKLVPFFHYVIAKL